MSEMEEPIRTPDSAGRIRISDTLVNIRKA